MTAQADPVTIFSNFNPDPSILYDGGTGWTIAGPSSGAGEAYSVAMAFTSSGTYALTQIDVAIGLIIGTSSVDLALYSDSGGAPGSQLGSWTITSLTDFGSCCSIESIFPGTSITLDAGAQYWLWASAGSDTFAAWSWNNIGQTGPMWSDSGDAGTQTQGAYDILGVNPVPEPASGLLVASAIALLGVALRRRPRL
jgi:hypothetical protein